MMYGLRGLVLTALLVFGAGVAEAQEVHQDVQELVRGDVLEVMSEEERDVMGTEARVTVQELRVQLLEGKRTGEVVRLENDVIPVKEGDTIFVTHYVSIDGTEYYLFKDIARGGALITLVAIFAALVIGLGRWQGVRALTSLGLSIAAIVFVLVPALAAGYSPALTSLGIAGVILAVSLFLTHGIRPHVVVTFFGTFGAVLFTCWLASLWVIWLRFSGLATDESVYLNLSSGGTLDLPGLLLGGIIIGLLGLLDDVSITQASVVQELKRANAALGANALFTRALRVGKDHVGSLVNTLALAYAGAALPTLLLFSYSTAPLAVTMNQEIIAAEIVRIIVGSIGLIMAVPFTTALAAWYFAKHVPTMDHDVHEHDHHHHHHGHAH